ncbi:uncharacterized protein TNCV_1895051 [Trichonephila clavipes]|nr:uncharacterized protein TNCV_1895051 [Trichonephila clavipes]
MPAMVGYLNHWATTAHRHGEGLSTKISGSHVDSMGFTCRNCGGGDRGRVAIYRPFGEVSLSLNRTVTCMVLKANDRRTSCPCHDEFRGPRSDYVRQVVHQQSTRIISESSWGSGSPVVKVSDRDRHVMSSSPVPPKPCRVGQRCTLNLSRAQTSSLWCGI